MPWIQVHAKDDIVLIQCLRSSACLVVGESDGRAVRCLSTMSCRGLKISLDSFVELPSFLWHAVAGGSTRHVREHMSSQSLCCWPRRIAKDRRTHIDVRRLTSTWNRNNKRCDRYAWAYQPITKSPSPFGEYEVGARQNSAKEYAEYFTSSVTKAPPSRGKGSERLPRLLVATEYTGAVLTGQWQCSVRRIRL